PRLQVRRARVPVHDVPAAPQGGVPLGSGLARHGVAVLLGSEGREELRVGFLLLPSLDVPDGRMAGACRVQSDLWQGLRSLAWDRTHPPVRAEDRGARVQADHCRGQGRASRGNRLDQEVPMMVVEPRSSGEMYPKSSCYKPRRLSGYVYAPRTRFPP